MPKKLAFVFVFVFSFSLCFSQLQWPSITKTTKPWTRWWWEGSAVTKNDLKWNLEQYQKSGIGRRRDNTYLWCAWF